MKYFYSVLLSLIVFSFSSLAQPIAFQRTDVITAPPIGGFGQIVTGVDIDGDGKVDLYAVSNNTVDRPEEMIPRIWKYEFNGFEWDSVWGAVLDIPLQNTWPGLCVADLDGDGRKEIVYAPVNNTDATTNPNPARIVVFETVGDGSDNMGVSDGFGGWLPNASTTIVKKDTSMVNLRPVKLVATDIDNDGKQELIWTDRAAAAGYFYGVMSVSDIPNDGNGTEVWNLESSGLNDPIFAGTGAKWDFQVVKNVIYMFSGDGRVFRVRHNTDNTWETLPIQNNVAGGGGSFRGSTQYDIDGDGTPEIFNGQWMFSSPDTACVWMSKIVADSLVSYKIAELKTLGAQRLLGAGAGDVDGDGKVDIIIGSRSPATPNNSIYKISYKGGDPTQMANWEPSIIDSNYTAVGNDIDILEVANMDGDPEGEIVYSSAYTRNAPDDAGYDIVILDKNYTPVSVNADVNQVPASFYLTQNYPNPFNPSTKITFGLTKESVVSLKIYDILGKEVGSLVNNQNMKPGTYNFSFNANRLASGTYIYKLTAGNYTSVKKMMLLK